MQKFTVATIILLITTFTNTIAQSTDSTKIIKDSLYTPPNYYERAKENIKYLIKEEYLYSQVKIDDKGVTMFAPSSSVPEVKIFWTEAEFFLKLLYQTPYHEMIKLYNQKGTKPFSKAVIEKYGWNYVPKKRNMKGLKVAIDPGHFAGTYEEAVQEDKYVFVKGSDVGLKKDIKFYEADLTFNTAEILKKRLENDGAIVYISRSWGESAVGKPFNEWYTTDLKKEVEKSLKLEDISKEKADWLLTTATKKEVFDDYYKFLDFVGRARRINKFKPDVTIVIHYNAEESNKRRDDGSLPVVEQNYSMVFVPGSYSRGELRKQDTRIDFLRLLLSDDLQSSITFASELVKDHHTKLSIPPISEAQNLNWQKKYAVYSGKAGVYHRNLYLTRAIKGTIVYGESLLQDNKKEAILCSKLDYTISGRKTSKRCHDVAESYYRSLVNYLNQIPKHPLEEDEEL